MYKFRTFQFDWLKVFVATPDVGAVWKKKFEPGVTPLNQFSLNLYTAGKFQITAEATGFSQILGVGDSNLDIALAEFPTEGLVVETPIEGPACRWCLSVDGGGKWSRERKTVAAGELVELTASQIAAVIPQSGWDGTGAPDVRVGLPFTVEKDSFVFVMERQVLRDEIRSLERDV